MNENHALCATREWSEHMRDEVVTYMTAHAELGESMLEIGPGPGASTEWLRHEVKRLVAVELDESLAAGLAARFEGANVEVVVGDATRLGYPDGSFDSVGCFTMLHHVPTAALQNDILGEALRVLRSGGVLVASDSLPSDGLHSFHAGDTYNPIDPGSLIARLQTIGFDRITVVVGDVLKFIAHKPNPDAEQDGCGEPSACGETSPERERLSPLR
jgi:ubiquinone/menaquinone biosynthesis C-methylase UbiE